MSASDTEDGTRATDNSSADSVGKAVVLQMPRRRQLLLPRSPHPSPLLCEHLPAEPAQAPASVFRPPISLARFR